MRAAAPEGTGLHSDVVPDSTGLLSAWPDGWCLDAVAPRASSRGFDRTDGRAWGLAGVPPGEEGGHGEDGEPEEAEDQIVADEQPDGIHSEVEQILFERVRSGLGCAEREAEGDGTRQRDDGGRCGGGAESEQSQVGLEVEAEKSGKY